MLRGAERVVIVGSSGGGAIAVYRVAPDMGSIGLSRALYRLNVEP